MMSQSNPLKEDILRLAKVFVNSAKDKQKRLEH